MRTNQRWYRLAVPLVAAVALVSCSDDEDQATPCDAAKDLRTSMNELADAGSDDLGDATEAVADDFDALTEAMRQGTRDEVTELGDQIGDLTETVGEGDSEELEDAIDDVEEAWGALVDEIEQSAADCDLSGEGS